MVYAYNESNGKLFAQIWTPHDVYPKYMGNRISALAHSYTVSGEEAREKAGKNNWTWKREGALPRTVTINDYFTYDDSGILQNIILIDRNDVTGWIARPEMKILVAPVGGFPDKGSLINKGRDHRRYYGRGIFEVNSGITIAVNKWKSMMAQILRDTAQPITQEFSATVQATPEQLRARGALFHYGQGEGGLQRVPPPAIPIEMQVQSAEHKRETQKGSFNDAVFGMVEGQPGYALSLLASSSANQILYPYMDAKHFVISEGDKFWLTNLKSSRRVFEVKGKFVEKLKPVDIPDNVALEVSSSVATPKDWMERGTIAGMLKDHLDQATIQTEILEQNDPQAIRRRRDMDKLLDNEVTQRIQMISGYYAHADYLDFRGDSRQAGIFRRAAQSLEAMLGTSSAGQGAPAEMSRIQAEREAGAPAEVPSVAPSVSPPEARSGFTPTQLRRSVGRGTLKGQ